LAGLRGDLLGIDHLLHHEQVFRPTFLTWRGAVTRGLRVSLLAPGGVDFSRGGFLSHQQELNLSRVKFFTARSKKPSYQQVHFPTQKSILDSLPFQRGLECLDLLIALFELSRLLLDDLQKLLFAQFFHSLFCKQETGLIFDFSELFSLFSAIIPRAHFRSPQIDPIGQHRQRFRTQLNGFLVTLGP
jgi:hypothetical protein